MKSKYGNITIITSRTFKDGYNRLILFDKATNKSYFIEEVDEKAFRILDTRIMIVITVLALLSSLWDLIAGAIISLIVFIVLEVYYRKYFIQSLREAKDFPVPENASRIEQLAQKDSKILILILIISLLLPAVSVYYILKQTANFTNFSFEDVNMTSLLLVNIIICLYSLYIVVSCIKTLLKKKK